MPFGQFTAATNQSQMKLSNQEQPMQQT